MGREIRMKSRFAVGFAFFLWTTPFVVTVAQAQDKIRLGLSSVTAMNTANWVAEERGGYFASMASTPN